MRALGIDVGVQQRSRPRAARRTTRAAARRLARGGERRGARDRRPASRRGRDRLPAALGGIGPFSPHRARARGAQHLIVQHAERGPRRREPLLRLDAGWVRGLRAGGIGRLPGVLGGQPAGKGPGGLPARHRRRAGRLPRTERGGQARVADGGAARPGSAHRRPGLTRSHRRRARGAHRSVRARRQAVRARRPARRRDRGAVGVAAGRALPSRGGRPRAKPSRCSPTASAATRGATSSCAGEFAPGHDAKRKAMLWARAREGVDAVDELQARGWQLPPEMR